MKKDKMKRFIELHVPCATCNLRCHYCYLPQNNVKMDGNMKLRFSPERIGQGLSMERLGGPCYVNMCASGETLIPEETYYIIKEVLKQGHYVNVVTNGSLTKRIRMFEDIEEKYRSHLGFLFSYHYLELKRLGLLEAFFENYNFLRSLGCSCWIVLNLTDKYIEHFDEIIQTCVEHTGYRPILVPTRKMEPGNKNIKFYTWNRNQYLKIGHEYNSRLFNIIVEKVWQIKRTEFCYSGDWRINVNAATGEMKKCHMDLCPPIQIFEDISKPIPFEAVGNNCRSEYCWNGGAYLSAGAIPELDIPSIIELRETINSQGEPWHSKEMAEFLGSKLKESNKEYNICKKMKINYKYKRNGWKSE